jgi:hypothetical protein
MRRAGWADVTGRNARHEFRVRVIPTVHIIKAATFMGRPVGAVSDKALRKHLAP